MYEKFEALLKEHNTTAYQVAKATGISNSTFSLWKSGRSEPKVATIQAIANYFGNAFTNKGIYKEDDVVLFYPDNV